MTRDAQIALLILVGMWGLFIAVVLRYAGAI